MPVPEINPINIKLAEACQNSCAACCKHGQLLVFNDEFDRIITWIKIYSPAEESEFRARCRQYDGFYLYDQQVSCQFLDASNLCRLHVAGVKPMECFWWPIHVYQGERDNLEIRVSTSCCEAYRHITNESTLLNDVKQVLAERGFDIFRRFRSAYKGGYENRLVEVVKS